ncbi:hypothetical protein ACFRI7_36015 [Streptomyces sp. NPDC056716]
MRQNLPAPGASWFGLAVAGVGRAAVVGVGARGVGGGGRAYA